MSFNDQPHHRFSRDSPDPTDEYFDTTPTTVELLILGMLGGVCGEPVSVRLQNYPPDIIGALQRLIRDHVPKQRVCEVFGPADLRRLKRNAWKFAVVLVYPTPGHSSTSLVTQWLLERCRRTRLPMAFLTGEQCDLEAPGAILRLGAGPAEIVRLRALFAGITVPDPLVREFYMGPWVPKIEVSFAELPALFDPTSEPLWTPRSLRSLQTLRGLLAGHRLLRCLGDASADLRLISPGIDDYAGVCELLLRSRAGLPGELGDPILAAMIRRANLYIKYREEASRACEPVLAGRAGYSSLATMRQAHPDPARNRPIGLRELADLGNVRSSLSSRLIDSALLSGSQNTLLGLGLIKRLPAGMAPGALDRVAIARLMVTWSMKQVRKRFDHLRREGFIDAERVPAGNGPWVIHLPEELKPLPGEFQGLPPVDRLAEACRQVRDSHE